MMMLPIVATIGCLALFGLVQGRVSGTDSYFMTPTIDERNDGAPGAIWVFGETGVHIYSPDGERVLNHMPNTDICRFEVDTRTGDASQKCSFQDAVMDGKKYVWATNSQDGHFIEVFSMETGVHVASVPTCTSPYFLEYLPLREEVWVRCWRSNIPEDEGHIDSFSVNSLSAIHLQVNLSGIQERGNGMFVLDSSLGNKGYSGSLSSQELHEFDSNTKQLTRVHELPMVSGLYNMAYSHVNQHLFLRAYVCCSCGTPQSDRVECPRNAQNVSVLTGPNRGSIDVPGTCGQGCEGSLADNIGVYEFDTKTNVVLGSHHPAEYFGANPWISPSGDLVFLLGEDGGQKVRVLKSGSNGKLSGTAIDLQLNFTANDGRGGINEVAFVEDETRYFAVFVTGRSNQVIFADLSSLRTDSNVISIPLSRIVLNEGETLTADRNRKAVWARGTDFVWVNGDAAEELYVLQVGQSVDDVKLRKTVSNVPSDKLLFVENRERMSMYQSYKKWSAAAGSFEPTSGEKSSIDQNGQIALTALVLSVMSVSLILLFFGYYSRKQTNKKMTTGGDFA